MKSLLFIALSVVCFSALAQDYEITFVGSGESTIVESADIQNITKGTSLTLSQGEVLHLKDFTTDIVSVVGKGSGMAVYPNPITSTGIIEFVAPFGGDCFVELYSVTGVSVLKKRFSIAKGGHQFIIGGLSRGVYTLRVQSEKYAFTQKLISKGVLGGHPSVDYYSQVAGTENAVGLKGALVSNLVEMNYTDGDRLLITVSSGIYSSVKSLVPTETKTEVFEFVGCTDSDGNNYKIVKIGEQTWMAENMRTTKEASGVLIANVTDNVAWGQLGNMWSKAYCYYNNNTSGEKEKYGAMYTYYAATKVCPSGWHLPTTIEWEALRDYLISKGYNFDGTTEGNKIGKALAVSYGWDQSGSASSEGDVGNDQLSNNATGFSGVSGGYRSKLGSFFNEGWKATWWTATALSTSEAQHANIQRYNNHLSISAYQKSHGYYVRCVKD